MRKRGFNYFLIVSTLTLQSGLVKRGDDRSAFCHSAKTSKVLLGCQLCSVRSGHLAFCAVRGVGKER